MLIDLFISADLLFNFIEECLHLRLRSSPCLSNGDLLVGLQICLPVFELRFRRVGGIGLFVGFARASNEKKQQTSERNPRELCIGHERHGFPLCQQRQPVEDEHRGFCYLGTGYGYRVLAMALFRVSRSLDHLQGCLVSTSKYFRYTALEASQQAEKRLPRPAAM